MILQNKAGEYYLGQGETHEVLYPFMENLFTDNWSQIIIYKFLINHYFMI